jgi:ferric iron reductase protein FhuF
MTQIHKTIYPSSIQLTKLLKLFTRFYIVICTPPIHLIRFNQQKMKDNEINQFSIRTQPACVWITSSVSKGYNRNRQ